MARISGVMIALNEAHQIHYALGSLVPWCDEVIVVDQHSEDATAEIAARMGARVLQHERTGGLADPARRFAVAQATGDWIFILDADEMVPPGLARRLRQIADDPQGPEVVQVPRANVILGRWMRFGTNWPGRHPRFFRPGRVEIDGTIHHSIRPVKGSRRLQLPADPTLAIWHFPGGDISDLVRKIDRYTTIEVRQARERGEPPARTRDLVIAPARYLWEQYLRGGGWRDGTMGLLVALSRAYYRVLVAAKSWEAPRLDARRASVTAVREGLLARWEGAAPAAPAPEAAGATPEPETPAPTEPPAA